MDRTRWRFWRGGLTLLGAIFFAQISGTQSSTVESHKVCRGTDTGIGHHGDASQRYNEYKRRYTNCTIVNGNLELVFLDDPPYDQYDLTFLESIREVTGYVLIMTVYADYVPLTSLTIIRGNSLYEPYENENTGTLQNKYSLYIALNYKPNSTNIGLKELRFSSLHEILNGDILIYNNNQLCLENTILWQDLLSGEGAQVYIHDSVPSDYRRKCGTCDASCETNGNLHCWGSGQENCQNLTRVVCSRQCEGHCFGPNPSECCHPQCIGGCTGPYKTDCLACKHYYDGDECVAHCPEPLIYDSEKFEYRPNPNVKYSYGTLCVPKCPDFLVTLSTICVKECGAGKIPDDNKVCQRCNGPCPKSCNGLDEDFLHAGNIQQFENCTRIRGSIKILIPTFNGDPDRRIPAMDPSELERFRTVKEITGYLMVQAQHRNFKDFSYFSGLETINGREIDPQLSAGLQIYNTSIEILGLTSLKKVENGRIIVTKNTRLCYADNIRWDLLRSNSNQGVIARNNGRPELCERDGAVCHEECSALGCWGSENDQCLSCKNFQYGDMCIASCSVIPGLYQVNSTTCDRCDEECSSNCKGAGPRNCRECKNFQDGPMCVKDCPVVKYPDQNKYCQPCHENCDGGCTGPRNTIGVGACNSCSIARVDENGTFAECLTGQDDAVCPFGHYRSIYDKEGAMSGKFACFPCDDLCLTCKGPGEMYCTGCKYFSYAPMGRVARCVHTCPWGYWPDETVSECKKCSDQCESCRGPSTLDCTRCKRYKVYLDEELFNCTDECPSEKPYTVAEEMSDGYVESVCVNAAAAGLTSRGGRSMAVIIGCVIGGLVLIGILAVIIVYFWRQRARATENTLKLTARMSGLEESEPLTPTDVRPDMSLLRLVKESELRRGNIIGSGAFGTVYRGVFIPDGENVKVPVAIKVLQEGTSPSLNKELLEEARVMASVDHPCCVRILAVCMTAQMMLITQLMPLGCLLDYVRKNRANIGSKALLNWCTQIARGMNYLEEKGIVHRDLAARNVLVQSPQQVRITDFGLAKLLDYNEEEYRSTGGKMPIKWLALECIQHRIFTHKSDVWSYGVTVWELFTFGQRPYENIRARDVPNLLEKGERLNQPACCTIDIYMIMIKCWMLDAESRPSFRELADEFAKMARDPGRYLAIEGDKFLRLPSHTYDPKELVRNMSIADGPEEIIEGDDYLQPTSTSISEIPEESTLHIANGKYSSGYPSHVGSRSRDYDNDHHHRHHGDRDVMSDYAASRRPPHHHGNMVHAPHHRQGATPDPPGPRSLEAAAVARKLRGAGPGGAGVGGQGPRCDSVSSRYTADPTKVLEPGTGPGGHAGQDGKDDVDGGLTYPEVDAPPLPSVLAPPGGGSRKPLGGIPHGPGAGGDVIKDGGARPPQLAVDEDDYLQPKSSNPAPYMDIIPDSRDYLDPDESSPHVPGGPTGSSLRTRPDDPSGGGANPLTNAMDNPEYFDGLGVPPPPPPTQTGKPLPPDPRTNLNNNIEDPRNKEATGGGVAGGPAPRLQKLAGGHSNEGADSYINTDYDHLGNHTSAQTPLNFINRSESAV